MKNSGPAAVLILFALIYSWIVINVASIAAKRFKRFSLRTLLIATTLASVVLGLAVYVLSK